MKNSPSAESENSTNSRRPMASAIADGAVRTSLRTSVTGGEKPTAGTNEDPTAVVVHEIPNDHTKVLPAIIKVKNGSGDPVLQCAEYFGRHILSLEVCSSCFLHRGFIPNYQPVLRNRQSLKTLIFPRSY